MKACSRCNTVDGFVIVDGASVECHEAFHALRELDSANDRIAELAQEVVALERRNDDDLRILGRRNSMIGLYEQYLLERKLVDDYSRWLVDGFSSARSIALPSEGLRGLAEREQGIEAAEIYLEKKIKKSNRGVPAIKPCIAFISLLK